MHSTLAIAAGVLALSLTNAPAHAEAPQEPATLVAGITADASGSAAPLETPPPGGDGNVPAHCRSELKRAPQGGVATIVFENDYFDLRGRLGPGTTTDRYYTHGTLLSFVSKCEPMSAFGKLEQFVGFRAHPRREARWGVALGQNIYTPEDIVAADPNPNDRPYAGWAYVAPSMVIYTPHSASILELQLGLVGPSAAADLVQGNWHDAIKIARAQGWTHQLKDEVAFVVFGERRWVTDAIKIADSPVAGLGDIEADVTGRAAVALGTVQTSIAGGLDFRIGQGLGADYGPPRIRPSLAGASFFNRPDHQFSWYLFGGVEARAVARDIFLDGNTWVDSPRVDKEPVVFEAQAGVVATFFRRVRFVYSYVVRSEEFAGQVTPSRFGSVSLSVVFGRDPKRPR
jgi:hypothetical protein